jgi:hypothetical protein
VADAGPGTSGAITEITPGGAKSTFASGLNYPEGLTFNSAGNLFVATEDGYIYKYSKGGTQSTFVSGLSNLVGLAFQGETLPVPEPSTLGLLAIGITALLVRRRKSWPPSLTARYHCHTDWRRMTVLRTIRRTDFLARIILLPVLVDRICHFDQPNTVFDEFQ